MTSSDLSDRHLPLQRAVSGEEGPDVWMTACMHGDEVGGIVVIQEVFRRLRQEGMLKGNVNAFPLLNPLGFEAVSRHVAPSAEDLNRCFPGRVSGSLAERLAHRIFSTISAGPPALVLDLHNDWRRSIPYAVLDPIPPGTPKKVAQAARTAALATGLLVVAEDDVTHHVRGLDRSLTSVSLSHGIPAVTLELGESFVVNERNVVAGTDAVWNVLSHSGWVAATTRTEAEICYGVPQEFLGRVLTYCEQPLASRSGLIRFRKSPGDRVSTGEVIARIEDAFGRHRETLKSECSGVVLGCDDSSVSFPGKAIMAFAAEPKSES